MAWSLALTAGGLIIAYLLLGIHAPKEGDTQTMNGMLAKDFVRAIHLPGWAGTAFVLVTLLSEGTLLFVAAQAGFIDGPRVLGYMAHDSWMPRWFANLSERLATHNGILLMGIAALAALFYTQGSVDLLLLFYSINVFITFSLSMIGMWRHWRQQRHVNPLWRRRAALFAFGALLCVGILISNIVMKILERWLGHACRDLCPCHRCLFDPSLLPWSWAPVEEARRHPHQAGDAAGTEPGRSRSRQAHRRDPRRRIQRCSASIPCSTPSASCPATSLTSFSCP